MTSSLYGDRHGEVIKMKLFSAVKFPRLLLFQLYLFAFVSCMDDVAVDLRAPRFVVHGHSVNLSCEHNVDPDSLYKVVFYKDSHRFMRYVQGRVPPFEYSNLTGAQINQTSVKPTSLTLDRMDFSASGAYYCEIALETPLYSKNSKIHEITVIVRQKQRPNIKIRHKKLSSNDYLEATCQSASAHPAPHLTWFINNEKVEEHLTEPHGASMANRYHHGMRLSSTNSSLHFPLFTLSLQPNQTLYVTCMSTIPSYASFGDGFADVKNHTISVSVVRVEAAPTQLPVKIISPQMNSAHRFDMQHLIIALLFLSYFTSMTLVTISAIES